MEKKILKKQTEQVFKNIETALKSVGAKLENIVKWNIYIVEGNNPATAFEVSQQIMSDVKNPPAITVVFVSSLANSDFLIEIDAVAVISK